MNRKIEYAGEEWDPEDNAGGYTEWDLLDRKQVLDFDGFYTDYCLWYNKFEGLYVCIFGDKDIYYPENADYDFETEDEDEAREWFDNYEGAEEVDDYDIDSSCNIKSSADITWQSLSPSEQTAVEYANSLIDNGMDISSAVGEACNMVMEGNAEPEFEDEEFYQDEPDPKVVKDYILNSCENITSAEDAHNETTATDIVKDLYRKFPELTFYDEKDYDDIRVALLYDIPVKFDKHDELKECLDSYGCDYQMDPGRLRIFALDDYLMPE